MSALTIHNYPGVTTYADVTAYHKRSTQGHWCQQDTAFASTLLMAGMMAHLHIDVTFPDWAEINASTMLEIPVTLKLYQADGYVSFATAQIVGNQSSLDSPVYLDTWPFNGDPTGLVQATGSTHLDFSTAASLGVPARGWFGIRVFARLILKTGAQLTVEHWRPLYSMLDPTAPERPPTEDSIQIAAKAWMQSDQQNLPFNLQVTELHRMDPILLQPNNPQIIEPFAYGYQQDFPDQRYVMSVNASLHDGIEGVIQPTVFDGENGHGNFDTLKNAEFLTYPQPAALGLKPNQYSVLKGWLVNSGNGFIMKPGASDQSTVAPGLQLSVLLVSTYDAGPAPDDTLPPTRWTINDDPIPSPTPVPPPPPPPPPPPATTATVPDLTGQMQADATGLLTAVGLVVGAATGDVSPTIMQGQIISQSPIAGTVVALGSVVNLTVSLGTQIPLAMTYTGTITASTKDGGMSIDIDEMHLKCNC